MTGVLISRTLCTFLVENWIHIQMKLCNLEEDFYAYLIQTRGNPYILLTFSIYKFKYDRSVNSNDTLLNSVLVSRGKLDSFRE